jgi:lysophospholipase L1-like esterase
MSVKTRVVMARFMPRRTFAIPGLLALGVLAGCSGQAASPPALAEASTAVSPSTEPSGPPLTLVALGDSDATGHGDETGSGWVNRYAGLVEAALNRPVTVHQYARDGTDSADLRSSLESDEELRAAIAEADIVVIGTGGGDLNAGDDHFAKGQCQKAECYQGVIAELGANLDASAATIAKLRDGAPTVLRAITLANALTGAEAMIPPFFRGVATEVGAYQALTLREAICRAMTDHGGECIDTVTAFNGADGTENAYEKGLMNKADCCYPSGDGQQLIAELLVETGLEPNPLN